MPLKSIAKIPEELPSSKEAVTISLFIDSHAANAAPAEDENVLF
ncbi:hypothetical protein [Thermoanaerobacter ethanolicus]